MARTRLRCRAHAAILPCRRHARNAPAIESVRGHGARSAHAGVACKRIGANSSRWMSVVYSPRRTAMAGSAQAADAVPRIGPWIRFMHEIDVVVIGAGAAGVAAARALGRRGIPSCVLEARDRVGGRGATRPAGDSRSISAAAGCIRRTRTSGQRSRRRSALRSTICRRRGRGPAHRGELLRRRAGGILGRVGALLRAHRGGRGGSDAADVGLLRARRALERRARRDGDLHQRRRSRADVAARIRASITTAASTSASRAATAR